MSFFHRFLHPSPRALSPSDRADSESIALNVTRILGSKLDYASFLPGFGLGETFHRPVTPGTLEILRLEILAQVEAYEPRLHTPQAVLLPSLPDDTLRFRLSGLVNSGQPLRLVIQMCRAQPSTVVVERGDLR